MIAREAPGSGRGHRDAEDDHAEIVRTGCRVMLRPRKSADRAGPSPSVSTAVRHWRAALGTMSRSMTHLKSTTTRLIVLVALLVAALAAAGCGSSKDESAADKSAAKAEQELQNQKPPPEPEPVRATVVQPTAGETDINKKPTVPKGSGSPPTALKAETLIQGSGLAIKSGQSATVNYVGVLFKDGKEFDTSWGKGKKPFQFTLGGGQVIPGWDQGVVGMKVGERRRLTIPADLAYGAQGSPPKIGPNEALIFDIDLKKIG
jgi:peptidylprolyl isomerase